MEPDLLKLSWGTLLTLAAGYAGYFVANIGVREHHKQIDVTFATLVFGFFAYGAYYILFAMLQLDILLSSIFAFAIAMATGGFWQRFGRRWLVKGLRILRISLNDDLPSAWANLASGTDTRATQLTVVLKDGTRLFCERLHQFKDEPDGPCVFGGKGDVLIYATHAQFPDDKTFTPFDDIVDAKWGSEGTYVPADQIAYIRLRRQKA